jgi:predicted signal transduction protein with EAL and GGDEF domain
VPGALTEDAVAITRAVDALSERGEEFTITASFGLVVIPHEAATAAEALELADSRMYARKRRRRATQARDVLQLLAEGEAGVTRIAAEIGLVTLSDASSTAHGPAGSSGARSGSSRSASPGR